MLITYLKEWYSMGSARIRSCILMAVKVVMLWGLLGCAVGLLGYAVGFMTCSSYHFSDHCTETDSTAQCTVNLNPECVAIACLAVGVAIGGVAIILHALGLLGSVEEIDVTTYLRKLPRVLVVVCVVVCVALTTFFSEVLYFDGLCFVTLIPFLTLILTLLTLILEVWKGFPRVPFLVVARAKRNGFLKHVVPCSPWHYNILTDYCGLVCKGDELLFGWCDQSSWGKLGGEIQTCKMEFQPPWLRDTVIPADSPSLAESSDFVQSSLNSKSRDEDQVLSQSFLEDFFGPVFTLCFTWFFSNSSRALGHYFWARPFPYSLKPHSLFNAHVEVNRTYALMNFRASFKNGLTLMTFDGPAINGYPLTVEASKDSNFTKPYSVFCTLRGKKTRTVYLDAEGLMLLIMNMRWWVEEPHPIVDKAFSDILHCQGIEDILWKFTKRLYLLEPIEVAHGILAGLFDLKVWDLTCTQLMAIGSPMIGLILAVQSRSPFFLLLLVAILYPLLVTFFAEFAVLMIHFVMNGVCSIVVYFSNLQELNDRESSRLWSNEFRNKAIINPRYFILEQEYSKEKHLKRAFEVPARIPSQLFDTFPNSFLDGGSPIELECHRNSRPIVPHDPLWRPYQKRLPGELANGCSPHQFGGECTCHDLKLVIELVDWRSSWTGGFERFEIKESALPECWPCVRLTIKSGKHKINTWNRFNVRYDVQKFRLIEVLFNYYTDPQFGGCIKAIRKARSTSFLARCYRFLDLCDEILKAEPGKLPTYIIAYRNPSCNFNVGRFFISGTNEERPA